MTPDFSMPSDQTYREILKVLPAGQRWFSFDVSMPEARKGLASRFGMTIWNFHTESRDSRAFGSWAITRDPTTGAYWYRVGKERSGQTSMNRRSLWDALQIAKSMRPAIPMRAVLKDGKSHRCAPACVFDISDVRMEEDESALWLKLSAPRGDVGTDFNDRPLPPMRDLNDPPLAEVVEGGRVRALPDEHYRQARDAAARVYLENGERRTEIQLLHARIGMNESTASALFNNFRCLLEGQDFKAPMQANGLQLFIDAIVARQGDDAIPNIITAVGGYVRYAEATWGNKSAEMRQILSALQREREQGTQLHRIAEAARSAIPSASLSTVGSGPSELLREVWVRGSQHAAFRRELLRRWAGKCSVHGVPCNDQLRASHIVPWSKDEAIRGDVNNGLLLSIPLDSLFDRGLISFDEAGLLIRSPSLTPETADHFGVRPGLRLAWNHLQEHERQGLRANLARHRRQHSELNLAE